MTYDTLDLRRDARGVVSVTLNRPEKRNVLSARMMAELTEVSQTLGDAPDTRAVVLSGAGKMFCAGADLAWMQAQIDADRAGRMAEARRLAGMLQALNTMPVPLIGRLHGGVFGGGIGLACVCDVVVAAQATQFCFSETRLGLIPATISPYVVARMGEAMARRVVLSARVFEAQEAVGLGLVAKVVTAEQLNDAVEAEVAPYLSTAPVAVSAAKRLLRSLGPQINDAVIDDTIRQLADVWETDDAQHGMAAFFAKSKPCWQS